jgi:hypothetical protein
MVDPDTRPGPEDDDEELLEVGQEEVFSRTEVERGVSEHAAEAGRHGSKPEPKAPDQASFPAQHGRPRP